MRIEDNTAISAMTHAEAHPFRWHTRRSSLKNRFVDPFWGSFVIVITWRTKI